MQEVEELFEKHATAGAASEVVVENRYSWVHRGIARAMVVLILGEVSVLLVESREPG